MHRIGRTARAGASGVGITLVSHDQAREFAGMVGDLGLERELELAGVGGRSQSGSQRPRPSSRAKRAPGGARRAPAGKGSGSGSNTGR